MKLCNKIHKKSILFDSVILPNSTSLAKVHVVKVTVFPVVMYRCESWTVKKAEHQRIDAFELWCWRRLLRGPWTARRSSQSVLRKSILNNPDFNNKINRESTLNWKDWCWSWSSNTLATRCEVHWKRPWCKERLKAGGERDNRGWDSWTASPTQWTWVWTGSGR